MHAQRLEKPGGFDPARMGFIGFGSSLKIAWGYVEQL